MCKLKLACQQFTASGLPRATVALLAFLIILGFGLRRASDQAFSYRSSAERERQEANGRYFSPN